MLLPVQYTGDVGKATAAAGTAIKALVPPKRASKTRLVTFRYTPGATAHTLTAMRPLTNTKVGLAAAAGQAIVVLILDPGTQLVPARPLAANDWIVLEGPTQNGLPTYILAQVTAVAAGPAIPATPTQPNAYNNTLQVTLTANLPAGGVLQWARCWMLGLTTDGHPQYGLPASATANLTDAAVGLCGTKGLYEPLLLWVDNITAAGVLENATVAYTAEQNYGQTPLMAGRGGEGAAEEFPDATLEAVPVYCVPKGEYEAVRAGWEEHLAAQAEARQAAPEPKALPMPAWPNFDREPLYYVGQPGDPEWSHPDAPPREPQAAPGGPRLDDGLPGG